MAFPKTNTANSAHSEEALRANPAADFDLSRLHNQRRISDLVLLLQAEQSRDVPAPPMCFMAA
jgi:hypothetical protein